MKLRIKGNSLRLRVTPSELQHLLHRGGIQEHIQLTPNPKDQLTYEVISSLCGPTTVSYQLGSIIVSMSEVQLKKWADSEDVGIYANVPLDNDRMLSVTIEKDFACLDRSDAENKDTFPNPNQAASC